MIVTAFSSLPLVAVVVVVVVVMLLLSCCAGIRVYPAPQITVARVTVTSARCCTQNLPLSKGHHWASSCSDCNQEIRKKKKNMWNTTSGIPPYHRRRWGNMKVSSTVRQILEAIRKQREIDYWSWISNTWTHRSHHSNWCRNFSEETSFNRNIVSPIISLHPQHYLAIHIPHSIYNHQSTILQFSHLVPTKYLQSKIWSRCQKKDRK